MQAADDDQILGQVDECRPVHEVGRIDQHQILAPGEPVLVRGWVFRRGGGAVDVQVAWGNHRRTIACSEERPDVMASQGPKARYSGFHSIVEIDDPAIGPFEIEVFGRSGGESITLNERPITFFRAGGPLREVPAADASDGAVGRIRRVADADPAPQPPGWPGRRSVRPGKPVEIVGWALDPRGRPPESIVVSVAGDGGIERHFAAPLRFDGEATASRRSSTSFKAGFACVVGPGELPAGLYLATTLLRDSDGQWWRGPQEPFQVLALDAVLPPRFLPIAVSAAEGRLEAAIPADVVRGTPIVARGWAIDPATGRGANVYAAFDQRTPFPIPSRRPRPHPAVSGSADVGFAGIAETLDLLPGTHRLRILALATSGALWYELAVGTVRVTDRGPE